uniref:Uncharacterized protein n=1 Tax=Phenylobacterium glaciei TaxID=2803784 RepID=A0A974SBH4_9CAUL|nr:hypothetical protein JKL49_13505 [Phenylobacterium glaciei]
MSAVALMMRDAGHEVSGSDEDVFPRCPPMWRGWASR